jgi:dephospho-CoA kinase
MPGPAPQKREVIAVTGSIGSGKSRVSRFLAERLACPHLDADLIARGLMEPDAPGWSAIKGYDATYITTNGRVDRCRLRHDIFAEPAVRKAVDSLIHPLVREALLEEVAALPDPRIIVEVPLLFEAGWDDDFERTILVHAEEDVCLRRVMQRDRVSLEQAQRAYRSQMGAWEKISRADHVIDNSGSWWECQLQLLHLLVLLGQCPV